MASDSAKQLASLAQRTGRPSAALKSRSNGRPLSQVEFAFLTRPLAGEIEPGMPTPSEARLSGIALDFADQPDDLRDRGVVVVAGRGDAPPRELAAVVAGERDRLDLGAAQVHPDPHRSGFSLTRRVRVRFAPATIGGRCSA